MDITCTERTTLCDELNQSRGRTEKAQLLTRMQPRNILLMSYACCTVKLSTMRCSDAQTPHITKSYCICPSKKTFNLFQAKLTYSLRITARYSKPLTQQTHHTPPSLPTSLRVFLISILHFPSRLYSPSFPFTPLLPFISLHAFTPPHFPSRLYSPSFSFMSANNMDEESKRIRFVALMKTVNILLQLKIQVT